MQSLEHFEQIGSRGFYRPVATLTFEQALDVMAGGMQHARALGLRDLLLNIHGLSGFAPPSTFGRYAMAVRGAEAGEGVLRLAMVAPPAFIDSQKIGVIMAQNRGLDGDVFTNEADAIRWLDSRAGARR